MYIIHVPWIFVQLTHNKECVTYTLVILSSSRILLKWAPLMYYWLRNILYIYIYMYTDVFQLSISLRTTNDQPTLIMRNICSSYRFTDHLNITWGITLKSLFCSFFLGFTALLGAATNMGPSPSCLGSGTLWPARPWGGVSPSGRPTQASDAIARSWSLTWGTSSWISAAREQLDVEKRRKQAVKNPQ